MSKFIRASSNDNMGDTVAAAFFPEQQPLVNDPWASLRERVTGNQSQMAQDTAGYSRSSQPVEESKAWERKSSADTYENRSIRHANENLSNVTPYDTSVHSIRRASFDTDDKFNQSRSLDELQNTMEWADLRTLGVQDAKKLMGRTASIWGTDYADLEDILHESMHQADARFRRASDLEKRKEERNASWEQDKMQSIAPNLSDARTPDIVKYNAAVTRTGEDSPYASPFGLANYAKVAAQEEERLKRSDERRASQLAIKRNGQSPAERYRSRRASWEADHTNERASTAQDVDYNWITSHLDKMSQE